MEKKAVSVQLGYPPSANRYWRTFRGMTVVSAAAKAYKQEAGLRARLAGMSAPLSGAVVLTFQLQPKLTKKGEASKVRIDLSNCIKVTEDALNGIAYLDDKQVVRIVAEVIAPVPDGGIVVTVAEA